jgi:phenol hydroxylase P3 protein
MDKRVEKNKHTLHDRYTAMTHDLHWETTYQPMDKVFPHDKYEGIKIHDWDKWQDPFRLTSDAYWKKKNVSTQLSMPLHKTMVSSV